MSGYALRDDQGRALNRLLNRIAGQMEAEALLISDIGGNILAQEIRKEDESIQTIAALAAGSFAATRELARMIGEPEFLSVFHRGREQSIFMQSLASQFLVVAIVQKTTAQGLVKLCLEKIAPELEVILTATAGQSLADIAADTKLELADDDDDLFDEPDPDAQE